MEQTEQQTDRREGIFHELDEALISTPRDFEVFVKDSPVWRDMLQTIEDRIEILKDELVRADNDKEIYKLQQTIQVWQEMRGLPYYLLEHAKLEQQLKTKANE